MAKHRKPHDAGTNSRRRRGASVLRGRVLTVTVTLCLVGSIRFFTSASDAAGGTHAASLGGSGHAMLPGAAAGRAGGRARKASAGPSTARPSPSGSPVPASSPPHAPVPVSGQSVTAVGDSVMVASAPALQQALPGIYIDAVVGRQFSTGLQVIADLKARGLLRPIVVVGLGTNGTVTSAEISQLFAEIGPGRKLVLVNTFEARPWEHEVNSILAATARDHPGVVLANWYRAIEHRTGLLWPDGIHPQPGGGVVYAKMLKAALGRLVNP